MFQGLRTNSLFYVLDKGENPNLQIGQVVSVSNPQTKYPTLQQWLHASSYGNCG